MSMQKFFSFTLSGLLLMPLAVRAQFGDVDKFINNTSGFINDTLIPILLAVSFLVFIVGVARYFFASGDEVDSNRNAGKSLMLWGVLAFVVIVSIWGIVSMIAGGLNLESDQLKNVPKPPTSR